MVVSSCFKVRGPIIGAVTEDWWISQAREALVRWVGGVIITCCATIYAQYAGNILIVPRETGASRIID